jgi:hypothetical protein
MPKKIQMNLEANRMLVDGNLCGGVEVVTEATKSTEET